MLKQVQYDIIISDNQKNNMSKVTILYNPRCSKCRQALSLLEGENCEIEIVDYLKNVPTKKELKTIFSNNINGF